MTQSPATDVEDVRRDRYWPEIDGLRALAVLSIFVFHLDRRLLGGGFVGVDIFFVISGFLIATVLVRDNDAGRLSLLQFYQRRIARIAPAFLLVLIATLAVGYFVYSSQDFAMLGSSAAATALSLINFKLLFQGNYFEISADAQPVLHYWSLAVEEQFYLLFPLMLIVAIRFLRFPLAVILGMASLSFAACVALTPLAPDVAFYMLPTRAWEFLAGSALALYTRGGGAISSGHRVAASWAGLALLLASLLFIRESSGFPGWIAAAPVLGTVLILMAITAGQAGAPTARFLANRPAVFVGRRSYSLYLWHWPIFSFVDYQFFLEGAAFRASLKVGLSIAATLICYRFVERPARTYLSRRDLRLSAFAGFVSASLAVVAVGWVVRYHFYLAAFPATVASGGVAIQGGNLGSVVLIGDSQAAMYGRELASLARSIGFDLNILAISGQSELPNMPDSAWPAVRIYLAERRPDVVIVAEAWVTRHKGQLANLDEAIRAIKPLARHVILVTLPPRLPNGASREGIRSGLRPPFQEASPVRETRIAANQGVRTFAGGSVSVVDVGDRLVDPDGALRVVANGRMTYFDSGHLSDAGTALLRPDLEKALREALGATRRSEGP